MDRQGLRDGKDRVLKRLIVPLNDVMRYRRPRGRTEMAQVAELAELQQRLADRTAEELDVIREVIVESTTREGVWPSAATILGIAYGMRRPGPHDTDRVVSYLRWAARQDHIDPDLLPALYWWLKARPRVPGSEYDWSEIRARAADDAQRVERLRGVEARGAALDGTELVFLARMERSRARVAEILAGEAGRAA